MIAAYNILSHQHPASLAMHMLYFNEAARISDLSVLLYLQRVLGESQTVLRFLLPPSRATRPER